MCSSAEQNEIKQKGAFFCRLSYFFELSRGKYHRGRKSAAERKKATPKTEAATK